MPVNSRPYFVWYDSTADNVLPLQGDNPAGSEFLPIGSANRRSVLSGNGNNYAVGDMTVAPRGVKSIVWSSEGYTVNGNVIPALTVAQKKATGSQVTNAGGTIGTIAGALDTSAYRDLILFVNFISFTGGTSIQFEYDFLDDAGTPASVAVWKPTALTAAGQQLVNIGSNTPFLQAAAAAATAPSASFGSMSLPAGIIAYSVPLMLPPNGQFQWTVVGTMTTCVWTAFIYGVS